MFGKKKTDVVAAQPAPPEPQYQQPQPAPPTPMTEEEEIEQIQKQTDRTMDDSVAASRRMAKLANETRDVGAETLKELNHQGEQLNRMENEHERIHENLNRADRDISFLEQFCCCCGGGKKPKDLSLEETMVKKGELPDPKDVEKAEKAKAKQMAKKKGKKAELQVTEVPEVPKMQKILKDDEREDELEKNLDTVGSILGDLKNQANEMNVEITRQNNQLDRLNAKTDHNLQHAKEATYRTENINTSTFHF